jgi:ribosome-associated heat shock protein Hsp15
MTRSSAAGAHEAAPPEPPARVRIDKWLWAARFYKTRTLAAGAVDAGHVRLDGERVKPAHAVTPGQRVEVRKHGTTWLVDVTALAERRGSATDAAALYRETAESAARRAELAATRAASRSPGRPTKKDRRKLEDFLSEP